MASPIINLGNIKFNGNKATIKGDVDFQGNTGTISVYLDSVPSGTILGPFIATITGNAFEVTDLPVGHGRWKVRAVVTPNTGAPVETASVDKSVVRADCHATMPLVGGAPAVPVVPDTLDMDPITQLGYSAAILAAGVGSRRTAAATYLSTSFGSNPRVCVYRNGVLVMAALSNSPLVTATVDNNVRLSLGEIATSITTLDGNLSSGKWTFSIQGGTNYVREIRGTVGNIGSSKHMKLSANPEIGATFESEFMMELPASIEL